MLNSTPNQGVQPTPYSLRCRSGFRARLIPSDGASTHDQAYFLFLYNPIGLYAVNKAVEFVPHVTTLLDLTEVSVTEQH